MICGCLYASPPLASPSFLASFVPLFSSLRGFLFKRNGAERVRVFRCLLGTLSEWREGAPAPGTRWVPGGPPFCCWACEALFVYASCISLPFLGPSGHPFTVPPAELMKCPRQCWDPSGEPLSRSLLSRFPGRETCFSLVGAVESDSERGAGPGVRARVNAPLKGPGLLRGPGVENLDVPGRVQRKLDPVDVQPEPQIGEAHPVVEQHLLEEDALLRGARAEPCGRAEAPERLRAGEPAEVLGSLWGGWGRVGLGGAGGGERPEAEEAQKQRDAGDRRAAGAWLAIRGKGPAARRPGVRRESSNRRRRRRDGRGVAETTTATSAARVSKAWPEFSEGPAPPRLAAAAPSATTAVDLGLPDAEEAAPGPSLGGGVRSGRVALRRSGLCAPA